MIKKLWAAYHPSCAARVKVFCSKATTTNPVANWNLDNPLVSMRPMLASSEQFGHNAGRLCMQNLANARILHIHMSTTGHVRDLQYPKFRGVLLNRCTRSPNKGCRGLPTFVKYPAADRKVSSTVVFYTISLVARDAQFSLSITPPCCDISYHLLLFEVSSNTPHVLFPCRNGHVVDFIGPHLPNLTLLN